jgi:hypothetical protein
MGWPAKITLPSVAMDRPAKITRHFRRPNKSRRKIMLCSTGFFLWQPKIISRRKLSYTSGAHARISLSLLHAMCPSPTLSNAWISVPATALGRAPLPTHSRHHAQPPPRAQPAGRRTAPLHRTVPGNRAQPLRSEPRHTRSPPCRRSALLHRHTCQHVAATAAQPSSAATHICAPPDVVAHTRPGPPPRAAGPRTVMRWPIFGRPLLPSGRQSSDMAAGRPRALVTLGCSSDLCPPADGPRTAAAPPATTQGVEILYGHLQCQCMLAFVVLI